LGLLDRVEEGQDVPACDVDLALQVTGDAPSVMSLREGPSNWREGPSWPRPKGM
jgi:hypothetical protein